MKKHLVRSRSILIVGFWSDFRSCGIPKFESGFRPVDQGGHSQHLFGAFCRLGHNSGAQPLPYFSTFVVHMIVGLLVGLSISDFSAFNLEIGLPIGGTVRSTDLVQLHTRDTFLEFTRSLISDMYTSMPFFNRRQNRQNHDQYNLGHRSFSIDHNLIIGRQIARLRCRGLHLQNSLAHAQAQLPMH